jgi:hypothetical protein
MIGVLRFGTPPPANLAGMRVDPAPVYRMLRGLGEPGATPDPHPPRPEPMATEPNDVWTA